MKVMHIAGVDKPISRLFMGTGDLRKLEEPERLMLDAILRPEAMHLTPRINTGQGATARTMACGEQSAGQGGHSVQGRPS